MCRRSCGPLGSEHHPNRFTTHLRVPGDRPVARHGSGSADRACSAGRHLVVGEERTLVAASGRSRSCAGRSRSSSRCSMPCILSRRVRRAAPLRTTASHHGGRASRPQAPSSPGGETGARPCHRSWPRSGQPLRTPRWTPRLTRPRKRCKPSGLYAKRLGST
jgi:hypothetical protein